MYIQKGSLCINNEKCRIFFVENCYSEPTAATLFIVFLILRVMQNLNINLILIERFELGDQ